jgi:hypothetical protein
MHFAYVQGAVKVNIKGKEDLTSSEYYYFMIAGAMTADSVPGAAHLLN